jgi:RND family efflux transporter MFP subunit
MGLSDTTQTAHKTNIATGRAELNTALTTLNSTVQSIASQKTTGESTLDDVAVQKGQVEQARAQVSYYQSQIAKAIIKAPFEGTVTKIPFNKGEVIQPNATAISLIGSGQYQIETNITESDVARVKVGDKARVTLDAYGQGVVFGARVIAIDLSETIIDGVPTYKTTLEFTQGDERILSGLTANIDILSDKKENVLFVPTRVISVSSEGVKTVQVATIDFASSTEREIETGLKGSDGRTEVISGLEEGELVVTE